MQTKSEIARTLLNAWTEKDEATIRQHLHEDLHFKGPMMELHSVDECIASMIDSPFQSSCDSSELVEQGDTVVHIFNWNISAPFVATIPAVEVLEFSGDKVKKSRLFFDTAQLPGEVAEAC